MDDATFGHVCQILADSETWDAETLKRCPKVFLIVRSTWIAIMQEAGA